MSKVSIPKPPEPTESCAYYIPYTEAANLQWTGSMDIPLGGSHVHTPVNGLGSGMVIGYFREHGFLGVIVKLDKDPAWHVRQCAGTWHAGLALLFGAEIEPVKIH